MSAACTVDGSGGEQSAAWDALGEAGQRALAGGQRGAMSTIVDTLRASAEPIGAMTIRAGRRYVVPCVVTPSEQEPSTRARTVDARASRSHIEMRAIGTARGTV